MSRLDILIAEDHTQTRRILKECLVKAGFEVQDVGSGDEALQAMSESSFDLVMTDMRMPGGTDGLGVLTHTKRRDPFCDVIVMTAHASIENAVEAMKLGASDYLQKPVSLEEVVLKVGRIANNRALVKSASDLRMAMDVTEENAGKTIQNLEMLLAKATREWATVVAMLTLGEDSAETRIKSVLRYLEEQGLLGLSPKKELGLT